MVIRKRATHFIRKFTIFIFFYLFRFQSATMVYQIYHLLLESWSRSLMKMIMHLTLVSTLIEYESSDLNLEAKRTQSYECSLSIKMKDTIPSYRTRYKERESASSTWKNLVDRSTLMTSKQGHIVSE